MSFVTPQSVLFDLVQRAHALAPTKSSLQILSNLRVTCQGEKLQVSATDLDHSIQCSAVVAGAATFDIAINARKLFEITKEIPDGEVTVEVSENVLSLVSEYGFSCKVAGVDVADFPAFPSFEASVRFSLPATDFRQLVASSSFAVSKDTSRSCLCGVLWEVTADRCTMVATDGHRLGRSTVALSSGPSANAAPIVSARTLQHVARIAETADQTARLNVEIADKYILISGEGFALCSKLLEGPYPDYEKVIPKLNPKTALVDRAALLDAVRRVSVLSNQKTHLVKFAYSQDTLEIRVLNRDIGGEARQSLPAEYHSEDHTVGFNALYLTEILAIVATPKVRLDMNTQISACLIHPWDDEQAKPLDRSLYLIMPLRLMDEL